MNRRDYWNSRKDPSLVERKRIGDNSRRNKPHDPSPLPDSFRDELPPAIVDFFLFIRFTMNGGPSGFSYAPSLNNPSPPLIRSNYCNFPSWVFDLTIESFELFADNAPVTRAFVITSVLFTVFLGIRGGGGGSSSKLALSYQVVNLLFQMSSLYSLFDFKLL